MDRDENEDFNCIWCNKEVERRILYCSKECSAAHEEVARAGFFEKWMERIVG